MKEDVSWKKAWIFHKGEFKKVYLCRYSMTDGGGFIDTFVTAYTLDKKEVIEKYWNDLFSMKTDENLETLCNKIKNNCRNQIERAKKIEDDANETLRSAYYSYNNIKDGK